MLQSVDVAAGNPEEGISSLVRECHVISTKPGSKRYSLISALKSTIYEKNRDELEAS